MYEFLCHYLVLVCLSNKIYISGKEVYLNITIINLGENKEQGVSSELVWDSDPEMMSMACCSMNEDSVTPGGDQDKTYTDT